MHQVAPQSKIVFLSQHDSGEIIHEAFLSGASGFVLKSDIALDLIAALQTVYEGKEFLSHSIAAFGPSPTPPAN